MAKDLRDLIEQAAADIAHYKRPNVDEAKERLSELLKAAGMGGIGQSDRIESISEDDGMLDISTSFVVRGCESGDNFELPSSVIDAEDPIKAATEWGLALRIEEAENAVAKARGDFERARSKLVELHGGAGAPTPSKELFSYEYEHEHENGGWFTAWAEHKTSFSPDFGHRNLRRWIAAPFDGAVAATPTLLEAFKDLAGRMGWDAAQANGSNLGTFVDERLQTLWDCLSRNPASLGVSLSKGSST